MRVAFLINELRRGGGQRTFVDDANALAAAGDAVILFTMYADSIDSMAKELHPSIRRVTLGARGAFDLTAAGRCAAELHVTKTTILISTLHDANVFARWVVLLSRLQIRLFRREANNVRYKPLWQQMSDVPLDMLSHRILAVSDDTRRSVLYRAPWRRRKVTILGNAVTMRPPVSRPIRSAPHILTVGRLTYQKDHATLIASLAQLAREGVEFSAEIVGNGPLADGLKRLATRARLDPLLRIHGPMPHEHVLESYASADVFVLSSRFEGSPHVILEAMAAGLPIVATAVGGVPELVQHGVSAMLTPPGNPRALADAIRALLVDPELRQRLGCGAYERAAAFSPERRLDVLRTALLAASITLGRTS